VAVKKRAQIYAWETSVAKRRLLVNLSFFDRDNISLTHRLGSESPCALSYPSANGVKDVFVKRSSAHWLCPPSLLSPCFPSDRICGKFIQGSAILETNGT